MITRKRGMFGGLEGGKGVGVVLWRMWSIGQRSTYGMGGLHCIDGDHGIGFKRWCFESWMRWSMGAFGMEIPSEHTFLIMIPQLASMDAGAILGGAFCLHLRSIFSIVRTAPADTNKTDHQINSLQHVFRLHTISTPLAHIMKTSLPVAI